ncbi:hypothetical protein QR680_012029 [Steinernema hermaphroditum]|uniref:EGF-like domain-containing protein n=1 Tax=Steinernema hermaphroditum TaxID=289476 RepID=A0AA39I2Z9_9BILA|nr:hypothetical protein QR680_012029 [Steinernema hermaphroditum]
MFSRLLLFVFLAALTVAQPSALEHDYHSPAPIPAKCVNGYLSLDSPPKCICPSVYTGEHCEIPKRFSVNHTVISTNFEQFTIQDPLPSIDDGLHGSTLFLNFESDDGAPISFAIDDCSEHPFTAIKINGKGGYNCTQLKNIHTIENGKLVLEVVLDYQAKDLVLIVKKEKFNNSSNKCRNGGVVDHLQDRIEGKCTCPTPENCDEGQSSVALDFTKFVFFENTHTPRLAIFEFKAKSGKDIELIFDKFPSEYNCIGRTSGNSFKILQAHRETFVGNNGLSYYSFNYHCLQDFSTSVVPALPSIQDVQLTLWVQFNYEDEADGYGFVSGELQSQTFEFTVKEVGY